MAVAREEIGHGHVGQVALDRVEVDVLTDERGQHAVDERNLQREHEEDVLRLRREQRKGPGHDHALALAQGEERDPGGAEQHPQREEDHRGDLLPHRLAVALGDVRVLAEERRLGRRQRLLDRRHEQRELAQRLGLGVRGRVLQAQAVDLALLHLHALLELHGDVRAAAHLGLEVRPQERVLAHAPVEVGPQLRLLHENFHLGFYDAVDAHLNLVLRGHLQRRMQVRFADELLLVGVLVHELQDVRHEEVLDDLGYELVDGFGHHEGKHGREDDGAHAHVGLDGLAELRGVLVVAARGRGVHGAPLRLAGVGALAREAVAVLLLAGGEEHLEDARVHHHDGEDGDGEGHDAQEARLFAGLQRQRVVELVVRLELRADPPPGALLGVLLQHLRLHDVEPVPEALMLRALRELELRRELLGEQLLLLERVTHRAVARVEAQREVREHGHDAEVAGHAREDDPSGAQHLLVDLGDIR
mmetsp:Transcript_34292/g.108110  ORF Transcript_34292/g.108110 Transcript_34292/m.108110 type:complete len:474 (-) Transcript_34292:2296-3717(-)